ncbi:MAG: DUF268 domain-containing protein, partial [Desulfosarcinaceae bacterium]
QNGLMFLSIPMGRDTLVWNAHRIYGGIRFPHLVAGWELLRSIGVHKDSETYGGKPYFQPIHVLRNNTEKHLECLTDVFKRYPNRVFIETGTLLGRGVKAALLAGFSQVHSIEVDENLYAYNCAQFDHEPGVHLHKGESGKILPELLSRINQPVTFWLDAHRTGGGLEGGQAPYPILDELEIKFGMGESRIREFIQTINPLYHFGYESSTPESESYGRHDILVAKPKVIRSETKMDSGPPRILYFCPDIDLPSAGIRRIYRHVSICNRFGYNAFILHQRQGFRLNNMPGVPITSLEQETIKSKDVVVIPEGHPRIMQELSQYPCRRFVLALNWDYVFKTLPEGLDWRAFDIERALVVSPVIGHMISWSMQLPFHILDTSIDRDLYYYDPSCKKPVVVYIQRKAVCIDPLRKLRAAR